MRERLQSGTEVELSGFLLAVHSGREDEVVRLIASGVNVNGSDADGLTPLMAAAMNGHVRIVRLLVAAGARRDAVNRWGMTAYDVAVWHGHTAVAALLMGAGGRENGTPCPGNQEMEDSL